MTDAERRSDGRVNASRQEWAQGSRRAQLRAKTREAAEAEIAKYPKLAPDEKLVMFASMTGGKKRQWELAAMVGLTTVAFKQAKHRAGKKIKEQREAEAAQGDDETPAWAFDDADVMGECEKPAPSEPRNALAGGRPGSTVHVAERVNGQAYGREDRARIIYLNETRRVGEGKPRIRWAPARDATQKVDVTNDLPVVTISVRSLSLDDVALCRADGTIETRARYGPVPTGLAYSPR